MADRSWLIAAVILSVAALSIGLATGLYSNWSNYQVLSGIAVLWLSMSAGFCIGKA